MCAYIHNAFGLWIVAITIMGTQADDVEFKRSVLAEHNKYRAMHGCPAIILDENLSKNCTEHAQELASKNEGHHAHNQEGYGENICITNFAPVHCVEVWYAEHEKYNFENAIYSPETGHFTQMIWKSTKRMGVGVGKTKTGANIVVARYAPIGNVMGEFEKNVPRLEESKAASACDRYFKKPSLIVLLLVQMPFLRFLNVL